MKIVFFGNGNRAYSCLEYLVRNKIEIISVITTEEEFERKPSLINLSEKNNIEYLITNSPNDKKTISILKKNNPDLFVLGGYSKILKEDILSIPKIFSINLHGGELPKYRGSSPLNWALINGESEFSISIIKVDKGVDTGDIIEQLKFQINQNDNIQDLHKKANKGFQKLLLKVINQIDKKSYNLVPQKNERSSYFPLRFEEDGFILFDQFNAIQVHNRIRALTTPYPCAFSFYNSKKIFFEKSELNDFPFYGEAGRIYKKNQKGILVCCKDMSLWITKAHFENGQDAIIDLERYEKFSTVRDSILKNI